MEIRWRSYVCAFSAHANERAEEMKETEGEKTKRKAKGGHSVGGRRLLPRIRKDLAEIINEAPEGIYVVQDECDMTKIHAVINGPKETPYEGGFFYFTLQCPPNYPFPAKGYLDHN